MNYKIIVSKKKKILFSTVIWDYENAVRTNKEYLRLKSIYPSAKGYTIEVTYEKNITEDFTSNAFDMNYLTDKYETLEDDEGGFLDSDLEECLEKELGTPNFKYEFDRRDCFLNKVYIYDIGEPLKNKEKRNTTIYWDDEHDQ